MKVVINKCIGGFELSPKAIRRYCKLKGIPPYEFHDKEYDYYLEHTKEGRIDPLLIQVIEELSPDANGTSAFLKIVEIPDDVDWYISQPWCDGREVILEEHRRWC